MAPSATQRAPTPQGKNQMVAAARHPEITGLLETPPKVVGGKKFDLDNPEVSPEVHTEYLKDVAMQEDEEEDTSAVQLRGLPFRATIEDVQIFLRDHAKFLKDGPANSIRLLLNRHGRPSGFARVQFNTQQEAQACRDALHTLPMDDRYVEVFIYSEWPKRTRSKKAPSMTGDNGLLNGELGDDVPCATKQEVLAECREGLRQQGANSMVLLSTLGALLSPEGRAFLRRTDQGLKHFLGQYPEEFVVEGAKGCEAVGLRSVVLLNEQLGHAKPQATTKMGQNYAQQQHQDKQQQDDLPKSKPGDKDGTVTYLRSWADPETLSGLREWNMPRTPLPGDRERTGISDLAPVPEDVPVSPPPSCNRSNPQQFGTPSDWGTPKPFPSPGRKSGSLTSQTANQANVQNANLYDRLSKQGAFSGMPGMCDMSGLGAWPGDMNAAAAWGGQVPPMWPSWPPNFGCGFGGFGGFGGFPASPAGATPASPTSAMGNMAGTMPSTPEKMPIPNFPAFMNMMMMPDGLGGLPSQKLSEEDQSPDQLGASVPLTMNLAADLRLNEMDSNYQAAVRLRGLPFEASVQDVLSLFSAHNMVDRVEESANAVQLLKKPNGKPSGQAVVQLRGRGDAQLAQSVLHGKWMGTRYVEVFACDAGIEGRRLESGPDSVMSSSGLGMGPGNLAGNRRNQGQNSARNLVPSKDNRGRNGQQGYPREIERERATESI